MAQSLSCPRHGIDCWGMGIPLPEREENISACSDLFRSQRVSYLLNTGNSSPGERGQGVILTYI